MQRIFIIGNLTHDPELKTTNDGKKVCNFSLAVNRRPKREGQPDADFFRVAAWGTMGENCQKYLAKGRKVGVTGTVSCRAYAAQDGSPRASMEVFANDVEFLSSGNSGENSGSTPAVQPNMTPVDVGDELPF